MTAVLTGAGIVAALDLKRAPSDAVRACVLTALLEYGQEVGDQALVAAAKAAMPAADPFKPPSLWLNQYREGFWCTADIGCGVDTEDWQRYGGEYWRGFSDEQRAARLADPSAGFADGVADAKALNEA